LSRAIAASRAIVASRAVAVRALVAIGAFVAISALGALTADAAPAPAVAGEIAADATLVVGHARHCDLPCAACHTGRKPDRHQRCAGCHDGSGAAGHGPAMSACTRCHVATTPAPTSGASTSGTSTPGASTPGAPTSASTSPVALRRPALVRAEVSVRDVFGHAEHARHAARGGPGARCTTCHTNVLAHDDNAVPAPAATTCATARCHDGAAAFAITAACTRCHRDPSQPGFKVARPTARYSHAAHAQVQLACAACHPLSRTGEVTVTGHAPCATCHADDFGRRQPRICGACHNGTEPWRALVADRGPPERTEFGATLDHVPHARATACTHCHALTTAASQLRPPRGHRACTGAACHAVATGPEPRLGACERCHRPGLAVARQTTRLAAPWSVRATFDHASHTARTQAAGAAPACDACHVDLRGATITELATPAKPTCAPCHDGATAFKLTGTTCTRCHPGTSGARGALGALGATDAGVGRPSLGGPP
jgi:c(7)-type cytochrome triheme protein